MQPVAFNAPHFPLHAPERDIVKYEAMYFEKGWDVIREGRMARVKALGLVPQELRLPERSEVRAKLHAVPWPSAGKANPAWLTLPEERRRDLAKSEPGRVEAMAAQWAAWCGVGAFVLLVTAMHAPVEAAAAVGIAVTLMVRLLSIRLNWTTRPVRRPEDA